jgi:hypothetical protein
MGNSPVDCFIESGMLPDNPAREQAEALIATILAAEVAGGGEGGSGEAKGDGPAVFELGGQGRAAIV